MQIIKRQVRPRWGRKALVVLGHTHNLTALRPFFKTLAF